MAKKGDYGSEQERFFRDFSEDLEHDAFKRTVECMDLIDADGSAENVEAFKNALKDLGRAKGIAEAGLDDYADRNATKVLLIGTFGARLLPHVKRHWLPAQKKGLRARQPK